MPASSRILIGLIYLGSISSHVWAFALYRSIAVGTFSFSHEPVPAQGHSHSFTALFSTPTGNRPPPRRTLKKRKNKRRQRMDELSQKITGLNTYDNHASDAKISLEEEDEVEIRPMRRRDAVEAGLDYWIDEGELMRERERRIAEKNRKATEGSISKERLREEVVAPYKQNWIGAFSVFIAIMSAIATKFPELLQVPVIPIPDL